jgi:hypothetical protein
MFTSENRTKALSVLLVLQGAVVLVGAVLLGLTGSIVAPLDSVVGADASIAAIVLGAAFIMAYKTPTRAWLNLAIMYNALAIVAQVWKFNGSFNIHSTWSTTIVCAIFLVGFLVLYPRGESMQMTHQH